MPWMNERHLEAAAGLACHSIIDLAHPPHTEPRNRDDAAAGAAPAQTSTTTGSTIGRRLILS